MTHWTDTDISELKSLWTEGRSGAEIAAQLGNGFTRSAVLGKVHRLALEGRKVEERTTPRPFKRKLSQPALTVKPETQDGRRRGGYSYSVLAKKAALAKPLEAPPKPPRRKIGIFQLKDGMCKWPFGDPGHKHFHFCGAETGNIERPYCTDHARIAYQPLANDRNRTARLSQPDTYAPRGLK